MVLLASILAFALNVLIWAMWIRFAVELFRSANPNWRPKGVILVVAEVALTITDPLIKVARKIIPNIRMGALALDFAWTAVMLLLLIAQNFVGAIH
jgi:YggT family protein